MDEQLAHLHARVAALETSVRDTAELVARTYERLEGWPARLEALRATQTYEAAFSGDPLVTVRIGTYRNPDALISRALASARRQTYPNWEAVVVGDGCEDDTGERVAALADPRIRFHNRPYNGPYPAEPHKRWLVAGTHAFNVGAELARGAWIAPIDQDDEWDDEHLEVLLRAAQRERAELVYGALRAVIDGTDVETWFGAWPPRSADFGFQGAMYHAGLRDFRYDVMAANIGEPADWNLARRMLEAGVRFHFVRRLVGTYHLVAGSPADPWWRERAATRPPFRDEA
jgi:glycosyltransferase involved in cell wall biosynthesis